MYHQERMARAEAIMETNRQDIDPMYQAISELRQLILQRTGELRSYMDGKFEAMDRKLDEQRKFMEDALKDVRREASINQRWMIGLTLVNTTMILGLGGKLFGVY